MEEVKSRKKKEREREREREKKGTRQEEEYQKEADAALAVAAAEEAEEVNAEQERKAPKHKHRKSMRKERSEEVADENENDEELRTDRKTHKHKKSRRKELSEELVEEVQHELIIPKHDDPPKPPVNLDTTILLFYAYCDPPMTRAAQDEMITKCTGVLKGVGVTGRLRVGREGFNATLTGPTAGTRKFTEFLRKTDPATFASTDFKYVDGQSDNKRLKELKVWPVTEIVTYGFDPADAPLNLRGTHLKPREFHKAMEDPNAIMIDVRNFNESLIGRFAPPACPVLDPQMRRSTEFPEWVENHKKDLEGKKVLMYCTAGVRCERASAFMRNKGVQNVFQLDGGIHRYLDEFPQDGGYWVGKNYTFDKRFSHGATVSQVVSSCVVCAQPWDRYQAQEVCSKCHMEVLVCKTCQRGKPKKQTLKCPLC